jgi:signal transduction histidine kinase
LFLRDHSLFLTGISTQPLNNPVMRRKETAGTYRELRHTLRQEELVSEIALGMNTLEDFSVRVNRALQQAGEHTGVSRVYIFEDSADGVTTSNTFEWCNRGIAPQLGQLQKFPYAVIPSWRRMMQEEGRIYSENIEALPADVHTALEPQGIRSIVVYPLIVQQRLFGFVGFDECVRRKRWKHSELELLRTISGIIAGSYERKLMEESLRCERDRANEANRAKDLFLANMSHEIRSPMNLVLGFSEALMKELPDPEQRQMVKSIITSGNLLLELLNDLLDLSRVSAGKMELVLRPAALREMLADVGSLFSLKAQQKGLGFSVAITDAVPHEAMLDEVRVKQVIFNLLGNAIKFTDRGSVKMHADYSGEALSGPSRDEMSNPDRDTTSGPAMSATSVERTDNMEPRPHRGATSVERTDNMEPRPHRGATSVERTDNMEPRLRRSDMSSSVRSETSVEPDPSAPSDPATGGMSVNGIISIKISDTGIGIPKMELDQIFEPFVQGSEIAGTGYGGTGLGLAICKRLVEQMHGTLQVESREGKGSVFTVLIPCPFPQ